jgi:hypothetical protein
MSKQTDYTPEEWKAIAAAPILAGLLVSVSDLSGPIGLAKEGLAVARAVTETAGGTATELIKTLAEGIGAQGSRPELPELPRDQAEARAALLDRCKQAAAAVTQKSPGEAEAYKQWLVTLARKTAEAAKEGGFLGIGGTRISEGENAALKDLAATLGVRV